MKKVAMIGVGKLGQDCAEVMSEHYDVVGYDVMPRNPAFPMKNTIEEAVSDRDIIFIAAPTPHDSMYGGETPTSHLPVKDFDYTIVSEILDEVNKHVNQNQLVVLISTVLPGTVRSILRPKITNARFIYNPYLIAMGTVRYDMVNPEMLIIGTEDGSTTGDAKELIDFYQPMMQNNPRVEVGTWDEAESIKIFYNTFISTKLALVNMIQDVAERNGNINVDIVTKALADSSYRIMGPAYMKAGLGDAGACHPRDNIALRYMAERLDLGYDLFDSIMTAREIQAENMALRCLRNGRNVTIIGKAYKPGVPYTNGSASMLVGHYIEKHGGNVNYYDIHTCDTDLKEDWTEVYLIGYWEDYVERLVYLPMHVTVIDPWRKYPTEHNSVIHYGDTRNVKQYVESENYQKFMQTSTIAMWPDITDYLDKTFFIYASYHIDYTLRNYPVETIVDLIVEQYNNGKRYFMFDCLAEPMAVHNLHRIQTIVKVAKTLISDAKYFYLSGCLDADKMYSNLADERGWEKEVTVLTGEYFDSKTDREYYSFTENEYDADRLRDKTFLNFNRMPRIHRLYLVDKLLEHNLFDKGYVSLGMYSDWKNNLEPILIHNNDFPSLVKNIDKFPLNLNADDNRINPFDIRVDDVPYFDNSYFSIVTETVFYGNNQSNSRYNDSFLEAIFPSEKVYKPIVMMHPFILISTPNFLAALRDRGYKTFHPFIDETYDSIEDAPQRMQAIIAEIIRLSNFSDDEWREWMRNVKPIVEHNKQHWYNVADYSNGTDIRGYFG